MNRTILIIIFALAVVALTGCSAASQPIATRSDPIETIQPRVTAPTTTITIDTFDAWINANSQDILDTIEAIEFTATAIAAAANTGDAGYVISICDEAVSLGKQMQRNPATLDPNAPEDWNTIIEASVAAYAACADGDFEDSVMWADRATRAMNRLTDEIVNH